MASEPADNALYPIQPHDPILAPPSRVYAAEAEAALNAQPAMVSVHQPLVDRAETALRRAEDGHSRALLLLAELVRDLARAVAAR